MKLPVKTTNWFYTSTTAAATHSDTNRWECVRQPRPHSQMTTSRPLSTSHPQIYRTKAEDISTRQDTQVRVTHQQEKGRGSETTYRSRAS
ncbi:hypothetical protein E2C01_011504 [Portunus trituberculatus]|uniref:Uncharacterized protein n=1 Tax=Portunus trituberculatus TaxID=210409 RepID=A0A5B7DBY4_PORTR|nr:hypothetical protein [Portunus trituberculatus]